MTDKQPPTDDEIKARNARFYFGLAVGVFLSSMTNWAFTPTDYQEVYDSKAKCESTLPRNVQCTFQPPKQPNSPQVE